MVGTNKGVNLRMHSVNLFKSDLHVILVNPSITFVNNVVGGLVSKRNEFYDESLTQCAAMGTPSLLYDRCKLQREKFLRRIKEELSELQ